MSGQHIRTIRSQRGFTLIELLVVVGIISVLSSIAIAQVMRARMAANEAATIASMKAILASQVDYSNACGFSGFATDLTTLGQPLPGSNAPFLGPDLTGAATVQKSGYSVTLAAGATSGPGPIDCNGTATATAYYASATPIQYELNGMRSFATSPSGVVWEEYAATAPAEPFGPPATPIH